MIFDTRPTRRGQKPPENNIEAGVGHPEVGRAARAEKLKLRCAVRPALPARRNFTAAAASPAGHPTLPHSSFPAFLIKPIPPLFLGS